MATVNGVCKLLRGYIHSPKSCKYIGVSKSLDKPLTLKVSLVTILGREDEAVVWQ